MKKTVILNVSRITRKGNANACNAIVTSCSCLDRTDIIETNTNHDVSVGNSTASTVDADVTANTSLSAPTIYGYVRVSTKEQNEARQMDAMKEFGVDQILTDKQSGKDFERPAYQELLGRLKKDDILVVKSIDRLGRNYDEILEQWRIITKEKMAAIVVLDMPLLDTRSNRDLTGTLIADIVLQLLSYVAETERTFIKQRQKEGIAAAKARGQKFGRPRKEIDPRAKELTEQWQKRMISSREAAKLLNISHSTFIRWTKAIII